jgi:hypothetical protein
MSRLCAAKCDNKQLAWLAEYNQEDICYAFIVKEIRPYKAVLLQVLPTLGNACTPYAQ